MLILGIESSGLTASAAVLDDEKLIAEYTVNNAMTHSQTLMPMIDSVMKSAGKEPEELDAIAISRGPGHLRVSGSVRRRQRVWDWR